MAYRTAQIFVSTKTMRRLRLVQKLFPVNQTEVADYEPSARQQTVDEIADRLLEELITKIYPEVIELERELARVEHQFAEKIHKKGLQEEKITGK